jgi:hypothetical protein
VRTCPACGGRFDPAHGRQVYCGPGCRKPRRGEAAPPAACRARPPRSDYMASVHDGTRYDDDERRFLAAVLGGAEKKSSDGNRE